jgi:hypothetical protein
MIYDSKVTINMLRVKMLLDIIVKDYFKTNYCTILRIFYNKVLILKILFKEYNGFWISAFIIYNLLLLIKKINI